MEPVINFIEMFAQSLNLKDPWYVERAEYNEKTREVHLYVSVKRHEYPCPKCGEKGRFLRFMCIVAAREFPVKRMVSTWWKHPAHTAGTRWRLRGGYVSIAEHVDAGMQPLFAN